MRRCFFLSVLTIAFFTAALFIRWFLAVAARATGGKVTAGQAWELGRGHGLRLATIVGIAYGALPTAVYAIGALATVMLAPPPMPGMPTVASLAFAGGFAFLTALAVVFACLWSGAAWVDAYRAIAGGGAESAVSEGAAAGG